MRCATMDRRQAQAVGATLPDVTEWGGWMEEWVGKRQRARRRTAGTQRMTRRAMVGPGQRREGQDVLEAEEQGVVEVGVQRR